MPATARRLPGRSVVTVVVAVLLVAAALAVAAVTGRDREPAPPPVELEPGPVVVVGFSGLRWADLDPDVTPQLWDLVGHSAVGSVSVRTVSSTTCPLDGWLSLSAGAKATAAPIDGDRGGINPGQPGGGEVVCGPLPGVRDGTVTGWPELVDLQTQTSGSYGTIGTLGSALADAGVCSLAVGPGAAVALADELGNVPQTAERWSADLAGRCPVTVVDAGAVREDPPPVDPDDEPTADSTGAASVSTHPGPRQRDLSALDTYVGGIVADIAPGTQVLLTGVADPSTSPAPFQVAMSLVRGEPDPAWLTSDSTRRAGLVQLIDVTATVTERAGIETTLDARPWTALEERTLTTEETVEDRTDVSALGEVIPSDAPVFGAWVVAVPVVILLVALAVLVVRRRGGALVAHPLAVQLACGAALFASALPPAFYLVSVARWWQWANPAVVLAIVVVLVALAVALLSAVLPVRHPLRFVAVQSAITWVTLTVDGFAGTPLQVGSPLGAGPVYGGRFFGFGNVTFAVYAASTFLLAAVVFQLVHERHGTRIATVAVGVLGTVSVVVDGWPTFGADFGGVIALVPGVVVLLLLLARVEMTAWRTAVVACTGVLVVAAFAFLDWLRPAAERSHMGDFLARVIDGSFLDVLESKLDALGASLSSPLGWAELAAFAITVAVVWAPARLRVPELQRVFDDWLSLRPSLLAFLLTCLIGSLVNDSGALIAGFGVLLVTPLLIATSVWWPARVDAHGPDSTAIAPGSRQRGR
jgi:hypothetical protein